MRCKHGTIIEIFWYLLGWANWLVSAFKVGCALAFEGSFLNLTWKYMEVLPGSTCDNARFKLEEDYLIVKEFESFYYIVICIVEFILASWLLSTATCFSTTFEDKLSRIKTFLIIQALLAPLYVIHVLNFQESIAQFLLEKAQPSVWDFPDVVISIILGCYLLSLLAIPDWMKNRGSDANIQLRQHPEEEIETDSPVMLTQYRRRASFSPKLQDDNNKGGYNGGVTIEEMEENDDSPTNDKEKKTSAQTHRNYYYGRENHGYSTNPGDSYNNTSGIPGDGEDAPPPYDHAEEMAEVQFLFVRFYPRGGAE